MFGFFEIYLMSYCFTVHIASSCLKIITLDGFWSWFKLITKCSFRKANKAIEKFHEGSTVDQKNLLWSAWICLVLESPLVYSTISLCSSFCQVVCLKQNDCWAVIPCSEWHFVIVQQCICRLSKPCDFYFHSRKNNNTRKS